jgi:hypothetical protein
LKSLSSLMVVSFFYGCGSRTIACCTAHWTTVNLVSISLVYVSACTPGFNGF